MLFWFLVSALMVLLLLLPHDRWAREFDLHVLWPQIRRSAPNLDEARKAFITHMAMDPAWRVVREWDEEMLARFIERRLI
jgi:hypothetical protein